MELVRYNRAVMPLTAKSLVRMMNSGEIVYDSYIQRACVWNRQRKSKLIVSMIYDMPIGSFITYKSADTKVYDCLDGKQRSHAIKEFIEGRFALDSNTVIEGEDYSDKYIYDLPEEYQDYIKDYSLNVIYFDTLTPIQQELVFLNLNNGQPISNVDRAWVATKAKSVIKGLCFSPLFDDMSTADKEKRKDKDLVIKICAMLKMEEPSMDAKDLNPFVANLELTEDDRKEISDIMYNLYKTYSEIKKDEEKIARKIYKPTHLISLVPFVRENGIETEFVENFFSGKPTINEKYNALCLQGSGHSQNIKARVEVIQKAWEEYKDGFEIANF